MLSGVVLSGGQSTRMGQEKGLAELRGVPLISYVSKIVSGLVDEIIVSVARGKAQKYRMVLGEKVAIVEDKAEKIGPLEGFSRSFSAAKGEYVLVAPCDAPFLNPRIYELTLEAAQGIDGAMPKIGWKYEPLHGAYRKESCLKAFDQAIIDRRFKLLDAMQGLELSYVEEKEIRAVDPALDSFWNLNSPEDLRLAEERLSGTRQ